MRGPRTVGANPEGTRWLNAFRPPFSLPSLTWRAGLSQRRFRQSSLEAWQVRFWGGPG